MNKSLFKMFSILTILALMMGGIPLKFALAATPAVFINEIQVSTSGTDWEFVELQGSAGTDLSALTLVGIESDTGTLAGTIDKVISLSGQSIPTDGFWLGISPAGASAYAVTGEISIANDSFENSTATYLLVSGFTGTAGSDLDTNNDGTLDTTPWDTILDSINIRDSVADFSYGAPSIGPDGTFLPSGAYRCPDAPLGSFTNIHNFSTPDGTPGVTNGCGGPPPGLELAINNISSNEGNSGTTSFDFTVSISAPAGPGGVTFDIATADDTATVAGSDYAAHSLTGQIIPAGSSTYVFSVLVNGDTSLESNETFFVNVTNVIGAAVSDGQGVGTIVNDEVAFTLIHDIQGSGSAVTGPGPFTVEAIVVGDFQTQGSGELRGFFIQEEDADIDADPATSEGIFVFCSSCPTPVNVGDKVQVTGGASEQFGMSQLSATSAANVTVVSSGTPLPTPAVINLPASGSTRAAATFENVEGMLVTFTDTLYVSEYFELARYGQLILTADARPSQFTDANEPSIPGYAAFLADLNSRRIILDDDNNIQNDALGSTPAGDEPYFWPRPGLSNSNFVRGGDSISGLTGVLHWSFAGQSGTDAWRVRPVEPAFSYNFTSNNERTSTPEDVGDSLKAASFNVLNYFTTINSRGADSTVELDRQREKTAAAICAMDADVVGLIEIENNGPTAISDLLNGLNGINANCGPYDFIDTGVVGTDEITVAFIYRPSTVSAVGDFAILDSSVDPRFNDDLNRPALAQTFQDDTTGGIFTVVVNHLKSKGSACTDFGDPDILDGQGNCNIARTNAAAAMVDWLATDPTDSGDEDFLIMGDLNSYRNEHPIDTIEAGADDTASTADDFTDLLDTLVGPLAYSYVFDGQLGYLDTGLVSSGLLEEVTGVTEWHINADEIPVFDYNDEIDDGANESSFERESTSLPIYEPNQYRSSDHDPIIVGLDVCDEIAPTFDEVSVTPSVLWPANHKYVDVTATVLVSDDFDPSPTITLVSVTSNEPDDGDDDGNTVNDIVIVDDFNFKLRAERSGVGTGRIYTITYMVTDACGNSATQSVMVSVPLNQ